MENENFICSLKCKESKAILENIICILNEIESCNCNPCNCNPRNCNPCKCESLNNIKN